MKSFQNFLKIATEFPNSIFNIDAIQQKVHKVGKSVFSHAMEIGGGDCM